MASTEINIVALVYPQPDKLEELSALLATLTQQVHAHEPDTLVYYSFANKEGTVISVVERYRNQAAFEKHSQSTYFKEFVEKGKGLMAKPFDLVVGGDVVGGSVSVVRT
ncbi:putative quinol monooxygenase [Aspergillus ibericus CBS 121593]|uniref:ABM domain-containing protein n=1 Tax=Aspergillus ibericus CBS 121593 TaxID=1448316 RepID=A0A395HEL7_9EURO|nr:hypothetical protein BO80DRAFT_420702 [Aspergillus ibericus CBS 121593]RAL06411.1 hypothetical protein BO80DRAFT_420702 [Aspergillus ibericus CBS 121593]